MTIEINKKYIKMIFRTMTSFFTYPQTRREKSIKPLPRPISTREERKSRRDDILLTAGFNPWKQDIHLRGKSRSDDTFISSMCRPCGTWDKCAAVFVRRLKPTVNQMSSLRDFLSSLVEMGRGRGLIPSLQDFAAETTPFSIFHLNQNYSDEN